MKTTLSIFLTFIIINLLGCGPMNRAPETTAGGGPTTQAATIGSAHASKNNSFILYYTPITQTRTSGKVDLGENMYLFRCVRSDNLTPLSQNATIEVSYGMPTPGMEGHNGSGFATRQSDGSYQFTVDYVMPGLWTHTLKIHDGDTHDEHTFEVTL